ncbi:unnamed protein product [Strongylus vulgaris]|uniref:Uncharacterized protein n=1 Tax=Strongylus vulgaris TaxID=40348 RepID=A0A3P7L3E2_STRVU|nr:unnamed protein product [Strongylus vulgaris]
MESPAKPKTGQRQTGERETQGTGWGRNERGPLAVHRSKESTSLLRIYAQCESIHSSGAEYMSMWVCVCMWHRESLIGSPLMSQMLPEQ